MPINLPRRPGVWALLLCALLMLSACSGQPTGRTSTMPTATPTATPASPTPTLVVATRAVHIPTDTGAMLIGTLYGHGKTAIIFANQTDSYQEAWKPLAQSFAAKGYMTLTFEYQGLHGSEGDRYASAYAENVVSAVKFAKTQGATRIALIGASIGGLAVVAAAARTNALALVSASAPTEWSGIGTADDFLQTLLIPKLFVAADRDDSADSVRHLYAVALQPKQLQMYTGAEHGVELLDQSDDGPFNHLVLTFIQTNAPA